MWKDRLSARSLPAVRRELDELSAIGCDLVRFAVPDLESAQLLGELAATTTMPLVADIHFDYRIALACLDHPLAKVRINPGNIGEEWKVREVVSKARDTGIALRIGVNAGSLPRQLQSLKNQAVALLKAAESEMESLERLDIRLRGVLTEILRCRFDNTGQRPVLAEIRLSAPYRTDGGGSRHPGDRQQYHRDYLAAEERYRRYCQGFLCRRRHERRY